MPSDPRKSLRWSQQRRLEFIDARLCWDGRLNRADLCETFGISIPQASVDIARYSEQAPGNLQYDKASRSYHAGPKYRPAFEGTTAEQFLRQRLLDTAAPRLNHAKHPVHLPVVTMPLPTRAIALAVLRPLWRAIHERKGLRVVYQSLTKPDAQARTLSPHALAHDGFRWHVRAYCHNRRDFRDFVIARILKVEGTAPVGPGPTEDREWNTIVTLLLTPNPQLNQAHRRAIELDYGMKKGKVGLHCRKAMLFYALHHLRLDETKATPEARQVVLKNAEQITRIMQRTAAAVAQPAVRRS